jgi:CRP/FNR family cyclic AMP-dependent transcriptional regulator
MMQSALVSSLKKTDVFKNLSAAQLKKLAPIAAIENHLAGTVLFKEGDAASRFYIVEKGRVLLQMEVDIGSGRLPVPLDIATVAAGHGIGWSVFAEPHRYTASCRCLEDSRMIAFNADQLKSLLDRDPVLGYEVMKGVVRILASRLDNTRELLFDEEVMVRLKAEGKTLL